MDVDEGRTVNPCNDCPFRNSEKGIKLHADRLRELGRTVGEQGHGFLCHKTTHGRKKTPALCAGSLAFTLNVGDPVAKVVVQIRLQGDKKKLAKLERAREKVYQTVEEFVRLGELK